MYTANRFYLMMGHSCNLRCIYCGQGQEKPCNDQHIAEQSDPQKIVSHLPKTGKFTFFFFGGEPFLYYNYMVRTAQLIKEHNPEIELVVITNGTLLTVARAKELNALGMAVRVSHDGPYFEQTRRTMDFLKSNPEPYLTLDRDKRGLLATCSRLSWDYRRIWEYFEKFRLGQGLTKKENVCLEQVMNMEGNASPELLIYDMPEFEAMLDEVFREMTVDLKNGNYDGYAFMQYRPILGTILYRLQTGDITARCGTECVSAHLDVHGNLYPCHNATIPNGHIDIHGLRAGMYNPNINAPQCQGCEAYIWCGGGCVLVPQEFKYSECYVTRMTVRNIVTMIYSLGEQYIKEGLLCTAL